MLNRLGAFIGHLSDTRRRMALTVTIAGIVFGVFDFLADRMMVTLSVPPNLHAATQAAVVGVGAGVSLALLLLGNRRRRRMIADELHRVAELNHTLRNSLQVIAHSHHSPTEAERNAMVLAQTKKIDEKLRELFPVIAPASAPLRLRNVPAAKAARKVVS